MNGKSIGAVEEASSLPGEHLNPFVHRLELTSTYEKLKTAFFTVAVLPLRVAAICGLLVVAWCVACFGLYGVSDEDLRTKPMTGWRKKVRLTTAFLVRGLFAIGGFHWVTVKGVPAAPRDAPVLALAPHSSFLDALVIAYLGAPSIVAKAEAGQIPLIGSMENILIYVFAWLKCLFAIVGQLTYRVGGMNVTVKGRQATRQEAPILVFAPHSTFLDAVVVYFTGFPSIIARWESGINPWLGKLINYTQPVYVWRDDADSRQSTIREITRRANSELDWPQILIFPEGTCTNRSCLITFKCGAFYPGVPVQPVCIRYPNKLDTVTWTWEGPGALKLLWLTLTQIHSNCEIEFLPVYRPNAEEKENPKLFANNVRKIMAKALGIPVTNFTYDDCRLISTAQRLRLPLGGNLVEMQRLRQCLGLDKSAPDQIFLQRPVDKTPVNRELFAMRLRVPAQDPTLGKLFELCDTESSGQIDWSEYLLALAVISKKGNILEILWHAFVMFSEGGDDKISRDVWTSVTSRILRWTPEKSNAVFDSLSEPHPEFITFGDFLDYAGRMEDLRYLVRDEHRTRLKSE